MSENSITTIARHEVIPGSENEFLNWVEETKLACKNFKGYMDTKVSQPIESTTNEFVTIFRFDTYENLMRWLNSDTREVLIAKLNKLVQNDFTITKYKGIDFYFNDNKNSLSLATMTVITYIGLMPLVLLVPPLFQKYLNHKGTFLAFTSTALIVLLMSYLVMPVLVKATNIVFNIYEKICLKN